VLLVQEKLARLLWCSIVFPLCCYLQIFFSTDSFFLILSLVTFYSTWVYEAWVFLDLVLRDETQSQFRCIVSTMATGTKSQSTNVAYYCNSADGRRGSLLKRGWENKMIVIQFLNFTHHKHESLFPCCADNFLRDSVLYLVLQFSINMSLNSLRSMSTFLCIWQYI